MVRFLVLLAALLRASAAFAAELEPAFRLPAGGRPLVPPVLDTSIDPPALWLFSEDRKLYLLSEGAALLARLPAPRGALPFLAVDPFGRALLRVQEPSSPAVRALGDSLIGLSRSGSEALRLDLAPLAAAGEPLLPPAFGADGRIFLGAGRRVAAFSPAGRPLWSRELPTRIEAGPATDGAGRLLLGLEGGTLLILSPYGGELGRLELGAPILVLAAFGESGLREPVSALPSGVAGLGDGRIVLLQGSAEAQAAEAGASRPRALASEGRALYGLGESGRAFALDGTGRLLWSVETGVRSGRLQLFGERLAILGTNRVLSLDLDGEILREAGLRNAAGPGLLSPSGLLCSWGEDWVLAAYRFERELGPPASPRPGPYGIDAEALEEALLFDPGIRDAERQLAILADIEKAVESGRIGEGEGRAAAFASAIARGDFERSYPERERRFRGNPLPRARACLILGRLGSPEALGVLAAVLASEADPSVRSAALEAIAAIGVDPAGEVGRSLEAAVSGEVLDEQVAFAVLAAVESLAFRSGAPPSVEAARALLALASPPYGRAVRDRAARVLRRIAGALGP